MDKQVSINIIGSGLGGLFCGAVLAKHGFLVNIFEAKSQIGGYATCWKRGDYIFDSSLHEINGFYPDDKKLRTFRFLDLFNKIKLLEVPSVYCSIFKDLEFKVPHSYEQFIEELINLFPDEKKNIISVMETIKNVSLGAWAFLNQGTMLKGIIHIFFHHPVLIKNTFRTIYDVIWSKIKTPKLRTIIVQLLNYYSDDIKKMNLTYFAAPTYSYINQAYWISGGSATLSNALGNIILENGGNIYTNKRVAKINFKNKKASSISLVDGKIHESNLTIVNSSLIDAVNNLMDKKDLPFMLRLKAVNTVSSTSLFSMYIGLKIDAKELGMDEFCYIMNDFDDLKELKVNNKLLDHSKRPIYIAVYNLDNSMCLEGKTVINLSIVDSIDYWEKYGNNKEDYTKEKNRIGEIIIDKVERRFPGFKENVELMEIGTPLTMKKFTGNNDGAVYGACQRISQGNIFRFPNEIKNRNIYFSSAWVTPGGGFTGVFTSAIRTAESILKKYKIYNQMNDYIEPTSYPGRNKDLFN